MTKLLEKLTGWLKSSHQSQLEAFINSKRPQNAAEVEYWAREYANNQWRAGLL